MAIGGQFTVHSLLLEGWWLKTLKSLVDGGYEFAVCYWVLEYLVDE